MQIERFSEAAPLGRRVASHVAAVAPNHFHKGCTNVIDYFGC